MLKDYMWLLHNFRFYMYSFYHQIESITMQEKPTKSSVGRFLIRILSISIYKTFYIQQKFNIKFFKKALYERNYETQSKRK